MVEVNRSLRHVKSDQDEYQYGVNMVARMEVDPLADHFVLVTLHFWETPDAQEQSLQPKVMKFAIRDDGAQALSQSLAESVAFNLAQDAVDEANERIH